MNDFDMSSTSETPPTRALLPAPDHGNKRPAEHARKLRGFGRLLLGFGALLILIGALGFGVWRHFEQQHQVMTTADQQAAFVPSVRIGQVARQTGTALGRAPRLAAKVAAPPQALKPERL